MLPVPLPHPQTLQKLKVPIIDSKLCKSLYWRGAGQEAITDDMLCAGYLEGERDACLVSAHPLSAPSGKLPRDILSHLSPISFGLSGLFLVYIWASCLCMGCVQNISAVKHRLAAVILSRAQWFRILTSRARPVTEWGWEDGGAVSPEVASIRPGCSAHVASGIRTL